MELGSPWPCGARAGIASGIAVALAAGGVVVNQFYGVDPAEPLILTGIAVVLLAVTVVASAIPALQALRVDPRSAMAEE